MKTTEYVRRLVMLSLLVICAASGVRAQTPPASKPDRGISPTGSYAVSDIENVNLANGNVNLSIPLASLPPIAGGKLSWSLSAIYNSKLWDVKSFQEIPDSFHSQTWTHRAAQRSESGGWIVSGKYVMLHFLGSAEVQVTCAAGNQQCIAAAAYTHKMMLQTPDGAKHELRPLDYPAYPGTDNQTWRRGFYKDTPDSTGVPMRYYSYDGSFLWAVINPSTSYEQWRVVMPDGITIIQNADVQQLKDTNGNIIEIRSTTDQAGVITDSFKDLLTGRDIKYVFNPGTGTGQVQYQRVGGGSQVNVDINFAQRSLQNVVINAGDRFCLQWGVLLTNPFTVITSIVLPQTEVGITRQLTFGYNSSTIDTLAQPVQYKTSCGGSLQTVTTASHGIGELSSITLPSGAIVQYDYEMDGAQDQFQEPFGTQEVPKNRIKRKRLIHDGVTDTWDYAVTNVSAEVASQSDGQKTKQEFFSHDPGNASYMGGSSGLAGLVYRTTRMKASNDQKITIQESQWELKAFQGAVNESPDGLVGFNPILKAEYTTLCDELGNPSQMSAKKYEHDFNGNMTSVSEYDFFSPNSVTRDPLTQVPLDVPTGVTPVRTTTTTYYNAAPIASDPGSLNVYGKRVLSTVTPLILNAAKETIVGPSQTQFSYDNQQYGVAPTTIGNVTKESHWDGAKFLDTVYGYDSFGNRTSVTDPKGNKTTIGFDPATLAQPTSVTVDPDSNITGDELTTTTEYDFSTGLVLRQTDPNLAVTETDYTNQRMKDAGQPIKDPYGRPGVVIGPPVTSNPLFGQQFVGHKRKTVMRYRDNERRVEASSDLNQEDDGLIKSRTSSDTLGRVILTEASEDGTSSYTIKSQSVYEQMGRITYSSNPMRSSSSPTDGWTRTTRDELGRVVEVATFDGATKPTASDTNWNGHIVTSYNAEQTTVTDQALKRRKSVLDGLGRLVRIHEDPDGLNYQTSYTYDALGNLTRVDQGTGAGAQVRLFTYDSLSRLVTAKNPEQVNASGQMIATMYAYDDASNLVMRTNPNLSTVGFIYDGLNRVKTKTLSTGGTFTYVYDTAVNGKGRLRSVTSADGDGCYYDSYDMASRITANHQVTTAGGQQRSYTMSYGYNLAGAMTREVYPSGKEVWTGYDSAGRMSQVSRYVGQTLEKTYASGFAYTPHGAVSSMSLAGGKMTEQTIYNARLQPTQMNLKNSATTEILLGLDYGYATTTNNGNMLSQKIRIGGTTPSNPTSSFNQTFTYDALNRLDVATETNGWSQDYDYDRFGNRWVSQSTGFTPDSTLCPRLPSHIDAATNHITLPGFTYDVSGNQKTQTRNNQNEVYDYDSENRLLSVKVNSVATGSYVYDGDGRRVKKTDPTTGTTVFVYNAGGQLVAEYTSGAQPNGTSYLTTDHLGSTRIVTGTDGSGNVVVKARHDYLPFGDEIPWTIGRGSVAGYAVSDSTRQRFTSKQRDTESGLDYFEARYYSSAQGRFTSPDEFTGGPDDLLDFADDALDNPTFYADLHEPQSLNKYQYCYNNPLRHVDVDGHGIRDLLKKAADATADAVGDFVGGAIRGAAASITYGYAPGSEPKADDSIASRIGQVVGTAVVGGVGTAAIGGGIGGGIVTSPTGVGAVAGGVVAVAGALSAGGALVNSVKLVTTPIHQKSNPRKTDSPVRSAERTPEGVTEGKTLTDKQAVQRLRRGQDVSTPAKQKAKQLQKKASGGAVHDEAHRPGYKPHFHGRNRQGGHAFHDQE